MPEVLNQGNHYEEDKGEKPEGEEENVLDPEAEEAAKKKKRILLLVGGSIALCFLIFIGMSWYNQSQKPNALVAEAEASSTVSNDFKTDAPAGFSEEQKATLRANGYTADEIETAQKEGTAFDDMVSKAKADREALLEKTYAELSSEAQKKGSAAYKQLLDETWLSGRSRTIPKGDNSNYTNNVKRDNCSYIKLPPRGNQLYLRLTLSNKTYLFFNVAPDRYAALPASGNMVVQYTETNYNNEPFITSIEELPIWQN